MGIDGTSTELTQQRFAGQPHEASQNHQLGSVGRHLRCERGVPLRAGGEVGDPAYKSGDPGTACAGEALDVVTIGADRRDPHAVRRVGGCVDERLEVGAAARDQDHDGAGGRPFRRHVRHDQRRYRKAQMLCPPSPARSPLAFQLQAARRWLRPTTTAAPSINSPSTVAPKSSDGDPNPLSRAAPSEPPARAVIKVRTRAATRHADAAVSAFACQDESLATARTARHPTSTPAATGTRTLSHRPAGSGPGAGTAPRPGMSGNRPGLEWNQVIAVPSPSPKPGPAIHDAAQSATLGRTVNWPRLSMTVPTGSAPRTPSKRPIRPMCVTIIRRVRASPAPKTADAPQSPGRTARRRWIGTRAANTPARSGTTELILPRNSIARAISTETAPTTAVPTPALNSEACSGSPAVARARTSPTAAYEKAKQSTASATSRRRPPHRFSLRGLPSSSCMTIRRAAMVATTSGMVVNNRGVSEMVAGPELSRAPLASSQMQEPTDTARGQPTVLCGLATQASRQGRAMISIDTRAAEAPASAEPSRRGPPASASEGAPTTGTRRTRSNRLIRPPWSPLTTTRPDRARRRS